MTHRLPRTLFLVARPTAASAGTAARCRRIALGSRLGRRHGGEPPDLALRHRRHRRASSSLARPRALRGPRRPAARRRGLAARDPLDCRRRASTVLVRDRRLRARPCARSPTTTSATHFTQGVGRATYELSMRVADGVICSTDVARATATARSTRTYVRVPRTASTSRATRYARPQRDTSAIGWAGGTGHVDAVRPWLPALRERHARARRTCASSASASASRTSCQRGVRPRARAERPVRAARGLPGGDDALRHRARARRATTTSSAARATCAGSRPQRARHPRRRATRSSTRRSSTASPASTPRRRAR